MLVVALISLDILNMVTFVYLFIDLLTGVIRKLVVFCFTIFDFLTAVPLDYLP